MEQETRKIMLSTLNGNEPVEIKITRQKIKFTDTNAVDEIFEVSISDEEGMFWSNALLKSQLEEIISLLEETTDDRRRTARDHVMNILDSSTQSGGRGYIYISKETEKNKCHAY